MEIENEIKILLVEDEAGHAILTQEMLTEEKSLGDTFRVTWVQRLEEAIRHLKEEKFDLVLLDLGLPDGEGLENVTRVRSVASDVPIVVLTGSFPEESQAMNGVRQGAQDYLLKDALNRPVLVRAIRYAIERKKLEVQLREAHLMLLQAEKMAVVGELAAGVAHEVKNPLGIILQGAEFLKKVLASQGGQVSEVLDMIKHAVERADKIIKGLLHFSRMVPMKLALVEMNEIIESSLDLVEKQFSLKKIKTTRDFQKPVYSMIDRDQFQQAFINIIMNAAQAMPEGGVLSLKTSLQKTDKSIPKEGGEGELLFKKGEEVLVCEVGDTGMGIPREKLPRVFDPFFTTKPPGEGTGLGLGITKSIIAGHRGLIYIESEEGKGTTVRIILPKANQEEVQGGAQQV